MSVRILSRVWDGFPGGSSDLLAMLALADWSDDDGRCWPSVPSIARKIRLSPDQARRVVHRLIKSGHISVTAGKTGGSMSRRYQINIDALTPCMDATPSTDARGGTDARPPLASMQGDPLHSCASRTVSTPVNRQPIGDTLKRHRSNIDGVPEGFDEFWIAYDKKVGRANSIKVWKSIKPDAALVQVIVSAAKSYSSAREQKYRKDPERWLKGLMWQDEAPAAGAAQKPEWMDGAI